MVTKLFDKDEKVFKRTSPIEFQLRMVEFLNQIGTTAVVGSDKTLNLN